MEEARSGAPSTDEDADVADRWANARTMTVMEGFRSRWALARPHPAHPALASLSLLRLRTISSMVGYTGIGTRWPQAPGRAYLR